MGPRGMRMGSGEGYRLPNVVRVIQYRELKWAGNVTRMEGGRSAFKILTGKSIEKRPLGRPRL